MFGSPAGTPLVTSIEELRFVDYSSGVSAGLVAPGGAAAMTSAFCAKLSAAAASPNVVGDTVPGNGGGAFSDFAASSVATRVPTAEEAEDHVHRLIAFYAVAKPDASDHEACARVAWEKYGLRVWSALRAQKKYAGQPALAALLSCDGSPAAASALIPLPVAATAPAAPASATAPATGADSVARAVAAAVAAVAAELDARLSADIASAFNAALAGALADSAREAEACRERDVQAAVTAAVAAERTRAGNEAARANAAAVRAAATATETLAEAVVADEAWLAATARAATAAAADVACVLLRDALRSFYADVAPDKAVEVDALAREHAAAPDALWRGLVVTYTEERVAPHRDAFAHAARAATPRGAPEPIALYGGGSTVAVRVTTALSAAAPAFLPARSSSEGRGTTTTSSS